MPDLATIDAVYKTAGITGVVCLFLGAAIVVLWRRGLARDALIESARAEQVATLQRELKAMQDKLDACTAARLADRVAQTQQIIVDREAQTKRMEAELNAQRDALESAAGAGRDQVDALDTLSRGLGELRTNLHEIAKDVAKLQAAKGGVR